MFVTQVSVRFLFSNTPSLCRRPSQWLAPGVTALTRIMSNNPAHMTGATEPQGESEPESEKEAESLEMKDKPRQLRYIRDMWSDGDFEHEGWNFCFAPSPDLLAHRFCLRMHKMVRKQDILPSFMDGGRKRRRVVHLCKQSLAETEWHWVGSDQTDQAPSVLQSILPPLSRVSLKIGDSPVRLWVILYCDSSAIGLHHKLDITYLFALVVASFWPFCLSDFPLPSVARSVRTLCDHAGAGSELTFCKGEELVVLGGVDQDWIRCRQGDKEGLVPIGYTSLIMWLWRRNCCTQSIMKKKQTKKYIF